MMWNFLTDIDNTLLTFKPDVRVERSTSGVINVIRKYAVEEKKTAPESVNAKIDFVKKTVPWWSWSTFLEQLDIAPELFWEYAFAFESEYLQPAEPDLSETFAALKRRGALFFITSNNPLDGIRHKLRLAGFREPETVFTAFLGATQMQAMKADPVFWRKVIPRTGCPTETLCTLGDDFHDDCRIPFSEGIRRCFLLNRDGANDGNVMDGMTLIPSISTLKELLP